MYPLVRAENLHELPLEEAREKSLAAPLGEVLLRYGVVTLLLTAPLAFGATSIYAGVALIVAAWLLLALVVARGAVAGQLYVPSHPVAIPALLLLGYTATHWVLGMSVAAQAAQLEWLRWTAYAALAVAALAMFDTPQRMKTLLEALGLGGLAIALLGIAQYLSAGGKIYWMIEPPQGGWSFGPYVNRNHFAGLMELWMPLALGLALVPEQRPARRWGWWMAVVAMGCAVILSGSRGGLLVMVAQFLLFAGWATRQRGGRRAFLAFAVTLLVIVGAAVAVGGTQIFDRAFNLIQPSPAELDDAAGYRIEAAKGTFELFRRNWLLGGGLESFSRLFPAVRSFATDKYWNYAHNDILQFLAELGIIGGVLAAAMLVVGGASAFRNLREHAGGANGPLLAGLACAVIGFLMHGALDFNFHVPANAASFGVLAALLARRGWKEE